MQLCHARPTTQAENTPATTIEKPDKVTADLIDAALKKIELSALEETAKQAAEASLSVAAENLKRVVANEAAGKKLADKLSTVEQRAKTIQAELKAVADQKFSPPGDRSRKTTRYQERSGTLS